LKQMQHGDSNIVVKKEITVNMRSLSFYGSCQVVAEIEKQIVAMKWSHQVVAEIREKNCNCQTVSRERLKLF
jgi:hypothetical protein